MFRKFFEKKQKLDTLKKDCFNAREELIVSKDNINGKTLRGCIELKYFVGTGVLDAWHIGVQPEKTYRVSGPHISYCSFFNPKNPMINRCGNTLCPMYDKYQNYLRAVKKLQEEKSK